MTFLTTLALAIAILVGAPYVAHRLRRKRAEEQPFPPARLVPPAPPRARRRSSLEDRALFATRTVAVVLLALLGATPFVRCSRLSLRRAGGASVAMALVVDDSMSMRAGGGERSRFDRARDAAGELLASAREGDAVALVLAGAPARVGLAATTDLGAARNAIDAIVPSDRATDLDGALAIAQGLVVAMPQVDRRVVVLSDLADGRSDAAPLGDSSSVPVWVALPELRSTGADCAVMRADRMGQRVRIAVACGPGGTTAGRDAVVEDADGKALGRAALPPGPASEVAVLLPTEEARPLRARITGQDPIVADDFAPVIPEAGRGAIAVVADATDEGVATGGAPIVEQALAALRLEVDVRPVPTLPDRSDDLVGVLGVLFDDPPGFTPEQRHVLGGFVEGGGVALVALGPRAAAAPLGATFEPVLSAAVGWTDATRVVADPASAVGALLGSAAGVQDLDALRRASLVPADIAAFDPLVRWSDGVPLVGRRAIGRGEAWIVTLPFSVEASDLPLRPTFLALLDAWVRSAREHAAPRRSEVGTPWAFPGADRVEARGPAGPVLPTATDGLLRITPTLLGAYEVAVDGKTEIRVAAPVARELDLRPRSAAPGAGGEELGQRRGSVDVSGQIALLLLLVTAVELALRFASQRRAADLL